MKNIFIMRINGVSTSVVTSFVYIGIGIIGAIVKISTINQYVTINTFVNVNLVNFFNITFLISRKFLPTIPKAFSSWRIVW